MSKLRRRACLAEELLDLFPRELPFPRDFYCDCSVEFPIPRLPNRAEATHTQARHQVEASNGLQRRRLTRLFLFIDKAEGTATRLACDALKRCVRKQFNWV